MGQSDKKKVLIIGASGLVGMATRDLITGRIGADVITFDRPAEPQEVKGEDRLETMDEAIERQRKSREDRKAIYEKMVANKNTTLDGRQAEWLLREYKNPPEEKGSVSAVDTLREAFDQQPDCIVISAGAPRKGEQVRKDVLIKNSPYFEQLGKDIAGIVRDKFIKDHAYTLPAIINAGNPMDTLTEIFMRALSEHLIIYSEEARENKQLALSKNLKRAASALEMKVMGMGGILDSSRAACAIEGVIKIPLEDIVSSPVIATHDENMIWYKEKALVKDPDGKGKGPKGEDLVIPLTEHPNAKNLNTPDEEDKDKRTDAMKIEALTKGGGKKVITDYKDHPVVKYESSAVLATGAGIMQMVDSIVNDKKKELPAAIYESPSDVMVGRMAALGKEGVIAFGIPPYGNETILGRFTAAEKAAQGLVYETRTVGG